MSYCPHLCVVCIIVVIITQKLTYILAITFLIVDRFCSNLQTMCPSDTKHWHVISSALVYRTHGHVCCVFMVQAGLSDGEGEDGMEEEEEEDEEGEEDELPASSSDSESESGKGRVQGCCCF